MELIYHYMADKQEHGYINVGHLCSNMSMKGEGMCKIFCPLCERRLCEITTDFLRHEMRVMVELKCPHCKRIVKVQFPVTSIVKTK